MPMTVARNKKIQKKILEPQEHCGPNVDLTIAEKQVAWFTYLIKDFVSELRSYDKTIVNFNATISAEIVAQTGKIPLQWRRSIKPSSDPTKTTLIISFDKPVWGTFISNQFQRRKQSRSLTVLFNKSLRK